MSTTLKLSADALSLLRLHTEGRSLIVGGPRPESLPGRTPEETRNEDFLSHYELGLAPRSQPCRRCSLSVYRDLGPARKKLRELRDRAPDRFGPYIAEGRLAAEHGKIKQEGADPDHHEWWAYDGVERHAPFRIVEALEH